MAKAPGYESVKFWERIAKGYAKKPVANEAVYQQKLSLTQERLTPDMTLLEFGCGTGSTAIVHAPKVKHITAIDVSTAMITIAQEKAEAEGVNNIDFQQSSIDEFEAPDHHFDAILGLSILHLVEDKEWVMGKVLRMLKPGGLFVTSTACIGDTMGWFRYVGPIGAALGLIPRVKVFGQAALEESMGAVGFELDHIWRPEGADSVFIIASKPASPGGRPQEP